MEAVDRSTARERISCLKVEVLGEMLEWWSGDHSGDNIGFVKTVSHSYLEYKRDIFMDRRPGDDYSRKMALQHTYFEGLELFFSLYLATLEAPDAFPVWMNAYTNAKLDEAVKTLNSSDLTNDASDFSFQRSFDLVFYDLINDLKGKYPPEQRWEFCLSMIFSIKSALIDYCSEKDKFLYNQIKHGNRAESGGGFTLAFSFVENPDDERPSNDTFRNLIDVPESFHFVRLSRLGKGSSGKNKKVVIEKLDVSVDSELLIKRINILVEMLKFLIASIRNRCGLSYDFDIDFPILEDLRRSNVVKPNTGNMTLVHKYYFDLDLPYRTWSYNVEVILGKQFKFDDFCFALPV